MKTQSNENEKLRPAILEGIRNNMKTSEIASLLEVRKWVIKKDIRRMRYTRDPELKRAYRIAGERKEDETRSKANRAKTRFQDMTGMSLKKKTYLNMLHYFKPELLKIMDSKDENVAISELSSSSKRCLKKHGIIGMWWKNSAIAPKAREYLENPGHKVWDKKNLD